MVTHPSIWFWGPGGRRWAPCHHVAFFTSHTLRTWYVTDRSRTQEKDTRSLEGADWRATGTRRRRCIPWWRWGLAWEEGAWYCEGTSGGGWLRGATVLPTRGEVSLRYLGFPAGRASLGTDKERDLHKQQHLLFCQLTLLILLTEEIGVHDSQYTYKHVIIKHVLIPNQLSPRLYSHQFNNLYHPF